MSVDFDGAHLSLSATHRFPNVPVNARGMLYWDVLRLWGDISEGISKVTGAASVGVDTWGVDYALLDKRGELLGNPRHYRTRTVPTMERTFERVGRRAIFDHTGIQLMPINGLYELADRAEQRDPHLDLAETLLTIPDLFHYWLTGELFCEFTHATTTQMYSPHAMGWDVDLLAALGIPTRIFPRVAMPGEVVGTYNSLKVIAPAAHDTGSAVVAVPSTRDDFAYISSGTWSLMGLELDAPIINDDAYAANLTNEGGAYGTFRLLKNVMGLWVAQQCRATWLAQGDEYSYEELVRLASEAAPFRSIFDPNAPEMLPPGDMPARIREYCSRTGQPVPTTVGEVMRAVYESLALKYRHTLDNLRAVSGRSVAHLHIIGGGSLNALLSQMTADATGCTVICGPVEATALGNAIVQLIGLGDLKDIREARAMLAQAVETQTYHPTDRDRWEEQYQRFRALPLTI
jgi:rhamnulokinase